jgi:glycerol-3-phosphate O-acyltransferase
LNPPSLQERHDDNPWPRDEAQPVIFILDAVNRVEERLLEDWLTQTRRAERNGAAINPVVLPISRDRARLALGELARQLNAPGHTLVTPVRVAWSPANAGESRAPRIRDLLGGGRHRPLAMRAWRIARQSPERITRIAGEPATIDQLRERYLNRQGPEGKLQLEEFAAFVVRQAGITLDIAERRIRGTRYKVPRFVSESLGSSPRFIEAIRQLAAEIKGSVPALQSEARDYLHEMVAIPRTFHIDAMGWFGEFMSSLGYEKKIVYNVEQLERVRSLVRKYPSALLWTHKSHVDGFVMYSSCYENDFPPPHILGGINMAFAGLGYMGRRAGAIFIRRSFQDNPLYKLVLRHYLGYLLEKRFPLSWSFEGTRSRVGKLMPPRYGLLKYVIEGARAIDARDLHFIPVAINYDLITDVSDYAAEQSGMTKSPESLRWFLGYLRSLSKPMGRIYMDFGEPVVLKEIPDPEDSLALSKIAFQVGVEVNKVTPITLPSLATMSLLGAAPRALTADELLDELRTLRKWAGDRGIRMSKELAFDKLDDVTRLANLMIESRVLTRYDEGPEVLFGVAPEQQLAASYYRNTIIHHFVIKAIVELALLKAGDVRPERTLDVFWEEVDRLRDLFKFEFFYAPTNRFREEVREELAHYGEDWEQLIGEGGHVVLALLTGMQPLVAHSTLLHYVEAYTIILDVIARMGPEESLDERACITRAFSYGRQAYLQRRISSKASIAKLLFQNGYKMAEHMGLMEKDAEAARKRLAFAREFKELSKRIDRIRLVAATSQAEAFTRDLSIPAAP